MIDTKPPIPKHRRCIHDIIYAIDKEAEVNDGVSYMQLYRSVLENIKYRDRLLNFLVDTRHLQIRGHARHMFDYIGTDKSRDYIKGYEMLFESGLEKLLGDTFSDTQEETQ